MEDNRGLLFLFETPQSIRFWDATFRATARSLQGLNIDRLLFSHLRCLTVVERNDVLNGLSGALRLRPALMVPKTDTLLLQLEVEYKERLPFYLSLVHFSTFVEKIG